MLPPDQLHAAGAAGEKGGQRTARGAGCCLAAAVGFLLLVALAFLARQWQQLPYPAAGAQLAPCASAFPCSGASWHLEPCAPLSKAIDGVERCVHVYGCQRVISARSAALCRIRRQQ